MSQCEFDPQRKAHATAMGRCPNEATVKVGADVGWMLCHSCAASDFFKRYKTRKLLNEPPAAPVYAMTKIDSAISAIVYLRETLGVFIDADARDHEGKCHCPICNARHAMAVTSGWKK